MRKTFKIVLLADLTVTVIACLLTRFIPGVFASVFTDEVALIALVEEVMPIFFAGIWIFGVQMACQSTFMGMGQAKVSLFIACLRKIVLLTPLALVLPRIGLGVDGIYLAEPISDLVSSISATILFYMISRKLLRKDNTTKETEE